MNRQLRAIHPVTGEPVRPGESKEPVERIDPAHAYGPAEVDLRMDADAKVADEEFEKMDGFEQMITFFAFGGCHAKKG